MSAPYLILRGVRVNNLKNIDVKIPRDKLVVFTGLSGSGKSSLAFETIYAEGHRRFVESLSSYARMFLGQLDKPDLDSVEGLSPAISIDQKTTSRNPRSTVGTVTEIYDYLRLLYARIGVPHCPVCGKEIRRQSVDQIVNRILALPADSRLLVLAPMVRAKKGMHEKVLDSARKSGFVRVRADGAMYDLSEPIALDKNLRHDVDIVVDRIILRADGDRKKLSSRLSDSVETALSLTDGNLLIAPAAPAEGFEAELYFSQNYACEEHNFNVGELTPRMFSFNNPFGACPECSGLGQTRSISAAKILPDEEKSLRQGAVNVNGFKTVGEDTWMGPLLIAVGKKHGFTIDTPLKAFSKEARAALLEGTGKETYHIVRYFDGVRHEQSVPFKGLLSIIAERADTFQNEYYDEFTVVRPCTRCHGARLNEAALGVTVGGINLDTLCRKNITAALDFFNSLTLSETEEQIAREIRKEIRARLGFLQNVGLEYLTLARSAGTLSGGEAQRIRLATQIGSALTGVLYILDEPSIGLHQRDNAKLIATLKRLRDVGNSLIVVEHDEETMLQADYILDIGPGAGVHGGQVVAAGTPKQIMKNPSSLTGAYLSGRKKIPVPAARRAGNGQLLTVRGAREHNLKNIDVSFPLGLFLCVTGVSGSGKSSLVNSILFASLAHTLNRAYTFAGDHDGIDGVEALDKVICIDQSPIGRTPRSNPATYTGLFSDIRDLFSLTPEAKARGYKPGRFSFNVKGGRCEACEGDGVKKIEMHFLPDVYVKCDVCHGKRYNRETLECHYKGKSISDVLDMTVEEGLSFFSELPKLRQKLQTLYDVGLGYLRIGQSSTTLSGGEAQRVKLATELARRQTGKTLYILDEPTTGLHTEDVSHLIAILQRLVDIGNSVVVIEHNLDVIKTADYLIDLGPEGGDGGGTVVCAGTPEQVAACPASYTGQYLKPLLPAFSGQ